MPVLLMVRAPGALCQRLGGLLWVDPDSGLWLSFWSIQALVGPLFKAVSAVLLLLWWRTLRATHQPPGGILANQRDLAPLVPWW